MSVAKVFIVFLLFILLGCNRPIKIDTDLEQFLPVFAKCINTKNLDSLQTVTTQNGYNSLTLWSDSLKSDYFVNSLSNHLQYPSKYVFAVNDYDSLVYLSLGKPDDIVGATGGYLVLRRIGEQIKVERFVGGK